MKKVMKKKRHDERIGSLGAVKVKRKIEYEREREVWDLSGEKHDLNRYNV